MTENNKRSLAKTVSWRVTVSVFSYLITWAVTGSAELAGLLLVSKAGFNTVWYFAHERIWNKITWGKQ
jgi:uncharacterized membrane protein